MRSWGLTGAGAIVLCEGDTCDPLPFLKTRKSRKFMGLQDDLAVVATGRALANAGLAAEGSNATSLGERAGLFLAVGYIPFREEDIGPVLEASLSGDEPRFDVQKFGAGGFQRAHPLLTFRCLPNMPAYHVSVSFDVQGPYCVTYPGPGQLYAALDEAIAALEDGRVDIALVGGVAAQSNFLVRHHFARIDPPVAASRLRDVAGVLVLESRAHAAARGAVVRGALDALHVGYAPPSFAELTSARPRPSERLDGELRADADGLGPAGLAIAIAERLETERTGLLRHELQSRDGLNAESVWRLGDVS